LHEFGISTEHLKEPKAVAAACEAVRKCFAEALDRDSFPVLVGGDHSLAAGSVAASVSARPDLCVIWFDAHADINTVDTSPRFVLSGILLNIQ